jgi:hypothetical protein
MFNHFTQPARIGSRRPAWPIRVTLLAGFVALGLVTNVLSYDLRKPADRGPEIELSEVVGPPTGFVLEGGCLGSFEPEEVQAPSSSTVDTVEPIVLPTEATPGAARKPR